MAWVIYVVEKATAKTPERAGYVVNPHPVSVTKTGARFELSENPADGFRCPTLGTCKRWCAERLANNKRLSKFEPVEV